MVKYLYVLTSTQKDLYYEQLFISITSLRLYNPNAFVSLLTDDKTERTLIGNRIKIRELINEIVVKKLDDNLSNMQKNRFLKTSMREHINGDFLYMDGDTIVTDSLHEISQCKFDVALALDFHNEHDGKKYLKSMLSNSFSFIRKNYNIKQIKNFKKYFNGGVIWCMDSKIGHVFFKSWHENWKKSGAAGIFTDQTALVLTNFQNPNIINELGGEYNCQIWFGVNYFIKAKIIHYFASGGRQYEPFHSEMPLSLKNKNFLSESDISMIKKPLGNFKNPTRIITEQDCEIYNSELSSFLRLFYKCKILYDALNFVLHVPRKIALRFRDFLRRKNR